MRIPKVLLFILLGLPALLLTGYSGRAEFRPQLHVQSLSAGPELREACKNKVLVSGSATADYFLDFEKPVVEHRTSGLRLPAFFRDPALQSADLSALSRHTGARYCKLQKTQAADYSERAFESCGLLIFPHHDFW